MLKNIITNKIQSFGDKEMKVVEVENLNNIFLVMKQTACNEGIPKYSENEMLKDEGGAYFRHRIYFQGDDYFEFKHYLRCQEDEELLDKIYNQSTLNYLIVSPTIKEDWRLMGAVNSIKIFLDDSIFNFGYRGAV